MMKRHVSVTLVFIAVGGLITLYLGCATPTNTNTNTNTVALASPEPTPDKAAIEAELTRIENDWPRILKERDAATVRRVEADDILLVYPDGSAGNKEQDLKDIESGALTADSWEVTDITVTIIDNDAAVVRLRTIVKNGKYKSPDGKSQDISGQFRSIDTFARRNGQWQLIGSATVKIMSPTPEPKPSPTAKPSPAANASPTAKATPRKPLPKPATTP